MTRLGPPQQHPIPGDGPVGIRDERSVLHQAECRAGGATRSVCRSPGAEKPDTISVCVQDRTLRADPLVIALVGLALEARIAAGPDVLVIRHRQGVGGRHSIGDAIRNGCRGIISFGIAGGLAPGLRPGDLIVASAVSMSAMSPTVACQAKVIGVPKPVSGSTGWSAAADKFSIRVKVCMAPGGNVPKFQTDVRPETLEVTGIALSSVTETGRVTASLALAAGALPRLATSSVAVTGASVVRATASRSEVTTRSGPALRPINRSPSVLFSTFVSTSVPAAAAAKLVHPEKRVTCLIGDGGFAMTMSALITCVQESLPVTVVVANNRGLGMVRDNMKGRNIAVDFTDVDFARIGEGMGCLGLRVGHRGELRDALEAAHRHGGPAVIDVSVDPTASHVAVSDY